MTPIDWRTSPVAVPYPSAVAQMEGRIACIRTREAPEQVWLLEHPALYTAGTSARAEELVQRHRLPVHATGRGGRYTYHGPGQRIAYVMLDLRARGRDLRGYVRNLEEWLIRSLAALGVRGERRAGRVGIWVDDVRGGEAKIAALGVRVRRWVTYHGVAINVAPDLAAYDGIVPCGERGAGVTVAGRAGGHGPVRGAGRRAPTRVRRRVPKPRAGRRVAARPLPAAQLRDSARRKPMRPESVNQSIHSFRRSRNAASLNRQREAAARGRQRCQSAAFHSSESHAFMRTPCNVLACAETRARQTSGIT